jgi:nitroreductase
MKTTKQIIEIKKPDLKADIDQILKNRFSPSVFLDEEISDKDIMSLFEAARWSPSCFNAQPWFFYYAKNNTPSFEKISSSLMSGNSWAKKAPLLILGCYIDTTSHGKNIYAQYDLGQSVFSLIVQAQSLGYYAHQMAGFDKDKAKQNIGINEPVIPHVLIAVGKIGDYEKADKQMADRDFAKRERKEVFYDKI